ncbi:tyrosine-type recombinase/integrase [Pseudomonas sp. LA21]|uniref:tyrosine-type recombinase/integrase n=1 Tax=Pseudomonas sp. LA21 TaxID=2893373 RepID=UPI001FB5BACA|nr:tyrosine-type recombinase/integrase [Pseudomonas sp. LA21]MCJ1886083.1 tyrosine-type recombinase/integrase [Pseudomonas sp. LA21]
MASFDHHLVRKAGENVWYVRLTIPPYARKAFDGKKVMIRSTKTTDIVTARIVREQILGPWLAKVEAARRGRQPPEGWLDDVAATAQQVRNYTQQQRREAIGEPRKDMSAHFNQELFDSMTNNPELMGAVREWVKQYAGKGVMGKLDQADSLGNIMLALLEQRTIGNLNLSTGETTQLQEVIATPEKHTGTSPITKKLIKEFRTHNEKLERPLSATNNLEQKIEDLSDFLKKQALPLNFDSVSKWLDRPDLKPATRRTYIWAGLQFWKWATKYNEAWRNKYKGQINPFKDHDLPRPSKGEKQNEREPFTIKEVGQLYSAASPEMAIVIKLAAYTGCRVEELFKLRTENIITVDGIAAMAITNSKTEAGIRTIPIHSHILELVETLKEQSKDGWLIPASAGGALKRRSHGFVNRFSKLKTNEGFGAKHTFHSLRRTVVTELLHLDVRGITIASIVGHDTGVVTYKVYSKGASMKQMRDALELLDLKLA